MSTLIPKTKTERLAARAFFTPKDARPVTREGAPDSIVYHYEGTSGTCLAIAFKGSAARPSWHHSFRNAEQRDKFTDTWLSAEIASAQRKAKRAEYTEAARENFLNPYKVGDILHTNWGYDQTNVEWFQVVAVGRLTVSVREIAGDCAETGFMSGTTTPKRDQFVGPVHVQRIVVTGTENGQVHHSINAPTYGYLFGGSERQHCSWYA